MKILDTFLSTLNSPEEKDPLLQFFGGILLYPSMSALYQTLFGERYLRQEPLIKETYFQELYQTLLKISFEEILQPLPPLPSSSPSKLEILEDFLYYFQDREEYEKCAKIHKYVLELKKEEGALGVK